MNIFKSIKLDWWQIGLFKLSIVSVGILIGIYWPDFFFSLTTILWILFIVPGLYLAYIWFTQ